MKIPSSLEKSEENSKIVGGEQSGKAVISEGIQSQDCRDLSVEAGHYGLRSTTAIIKRWNKIGKDVWHYEAVDSEIEFTAAGECRNCLLKQRRLQTAFFNDHRMNIFGGRQ